MNRETHPIEQEEVMAYLDGELPAARAAGVAAHLEECSDCQALAADLRGISQKMTAWQIEPSPASLTERVHLAGEHISSSLRRDMPSRRSSLSYLLAHPLVWSTACAVFALLIAAKVFTPSLLMSPKQRALEKEAAEARVRGFADINPSVPLRRRNQMPAISGGGGSGEAEPSLEHQALSRKGTLGKLEPNSPEAGPMIARTAALTIVAKDFDAARAGVERIVTLHRGYVAELSTTSPQNAARTLAASLRIPAPQLDAALAELKQLGRVEQETQSGEEVTKQYTDLVARLKNSRATEQRLLEILRQRPGKVKEVLEVEQEIARVREEIEQMEAERRGIEKRVQFASLRLQVNEDYKKQIEVTPPSTGTRLRNALVDGYREAADTVLGFVLFLFEYGLTLLLWAAILFFPARWAWRRLRAWRVVEGSSANA